MRRTVFFRCHLPKDVICDGHVAVAAVLNRWVKVRSKSTGGNVPARRLAHLTLMPPLFMLQDQITACLPDISHVITDHT